MKNKFVLWMVIGCLAVAGAIATIVIWKSVLKHYQRVQAAAIPPAKPTDNSGDYRPPSWTKNALYVAAHDGELDKVKQMLDAHPEALNQGVGGARSTLLHTAAYNSRANVVGELLIRKAAVNARNKAGHTPLYDCVDGGTAEITLMLLEHGADVTIPDYAGKTPLQLAVEKNHNDMAEILRQHGAQE